MKHDWQKEAVDAASGRTIYAREVPHARQGNYGTYDFAIAREFQVRSATGEVLFQTSGSAEGEYWCGVFLFFVDGAEGAKVRLEISEEPEDQIFDVPDTPVPASKLWT
ncbi:MAG: hypothetical protein AAGJ28_01835 [Pseudomonadota bacterium]